MNRTLFSFSMIALGVAGIFQSCTPETVVEPPLMTVTPSEPVNAAKGEALSYQVVISSVSDISKVELTAKLDGSNLFSDDSVFAAGTTSAIANFTFTVPLTVSAGSSITLDFLATNEGSTKLVTTTVTVKAGEISTYTAVIMSDLENPDGSSFYSVEDNKLMTLNQAVASSGEVDLIYYYGATNKATLCAPNDASVRAFTGASGAVIVDRLETKNATKVAMVEMTAAEFTAVADDSQILAKKPATTVTAANNLAKDKVVYCETVTGKKALVLVKNITGGTGTRYIPIEVKVQK
jgi:hypothetical protein